MVVPVYNRARTVLETLTSVARQTRPPAQLIVIDDGSTDDLAAAFQKWVKDLAPAFPATLVRKDRGGASAARNRALEIAGSGPFVAFLDSDDCWPPDFLERTEDQLAKRPEAVAVSVDQLKVDFRSGRKRLRSLKALPSNPVLWIFEHGGGIGSATLFRRSTVRDLGGYPEHLPTGHDIDLFVRISRRGPWLFSEGLPVQMGSHNARLAGEADHLHRDLGNYEERWAAIYEEILNHDGVSALLPPATVDRLMSKRWLLAARSWERLGDPAAALGCYRRSYSRRPSFRAWLKLKTLTWGQRKEARSRA